MSDEFKLQTLLEVRSRAKDEAERSLAEANAAVTTAHEELVERQGTADATLAEIHERQQRSRSLDVQAEQQRHQYVRALQIQHEQELRAVEEQRAVLREREATAERRRELLVEADSELSVVEQQRDKWLEEQRMKQMRKAEEAMDEVAVRRWAEKRDE